MIKSGEKWSREEMGVTTNGSEISFGGNEDVLELVMGPSF